ncbi:MAG TPA: hypothetical protein VK148_29735 [Xanthobacteraceae bacterium]|jgi:hypothetical protein|nr:hypothetical protein [Xanthobacteraceae bacterium]
MTGLVLFLLGAVAAIFTAAQLQQQGYAWADQICFTAYNLCNQPFSLGLTAGLISSFYLLLVIGEYHTPPKD